MCLPSLPRDQPLSPLAKFMAGFLWKIHHCPSPAHLVFCWVLLFGNSFACLLLFHPFLSISTTVAQVHSLYSYSPPLIMRSPPMLPASLSIVSPSIVHPLPKEGPHSSPRHAPRPTSWAHVAYILDRVAFWQLRRLHLAPKLCCVWPHS